MTPFLNDGVNTNTPILAKTIIEGITFKRRAQRFGNNVSIDEICFKNIIDGAQPRKLWIKEVKICMEAPAFRFWIRQEMLERFYDKQTQSKTQESADDRRR